MGMQTTEIEKVYFDWMTSKVFKNEYDRDSYLDLLSQMHNVIFTYSIPMDENRYLDGVDLKKTFLWENNLDNSYLECLGNECSLLEMMVALSCRCETSIMSNPEYGNRTWMWFHIMLENMGLLDMTNEYYDRRYIAERISVLLERRYDYDGTGGLFKVPNTQYDMRRIEIWAQLNWFLDTIN